MLYVSVLRQLILCQVIESKRYSAHPLQGGLEIPFIMAKDTANVEELVTDTRHLTGKD